MRSSKIFLTLATICCFVIISNAQQEKKTEEVCYNPNAKGDTTKRSIKSAAIGKIGAANIIINYYSPGVRKRVIWGGLVPYDEVWVTGAHYATNIETDKTIIVGGTSIPPGKYAFFTIPGKHIWTVILNKNWDQHLTDDYDPKDDIVRIEVQPTIPGQPIERLQYFINSLTANKGAIAVGWDQQLIQFEVQAN
ncbi:MAG: DUF2911 domain-containing protein [Bacteroidota bacterium]